MNSNVGDINSIIKALQERKRIVKSNDKVGIITGHGETDIKNMCIIPENLTIITSTKSETFAPGAVNYSSNFLSYQNRRQFVENSFTGIYKGNSLIQNLKITFDSIFFDDNKKLLDIPVFDYTGIITDEITEPTHGPLQIDNPFTRKLIAENKSIKEKTKLCFASEEIKLKSLKYNNNNIYKNDEIWFKTFSLNEILNHLSKMVKQNPLIPKIYILDVCRVGNYNNINLNPEALCIQSEN